MAKKEITLKTEVSVYNNIFNRVGFNLANGRSIDLNRNGQFKIVTVEDLDYLLSIAPAMLTEGILYIKDEDIREYLDINEYYESGAIIASESIDEILELDAENLKKILKNASKPAKEEVVKKARKKADELTGAQVKAIEESTKMEIVDKV